MSKSESHSYLMQSK